uniref:Uncharacterized protein n=1 Tax=Lactuca sativa TaxID=4236 RepID=A0A9R1W903_LACSA|nr:hypothetical protein LSAT_V11C300137410 [Lactuca sativa]
MDDFHNPRVQISLLYHVCMFFRHWISKSSSTVLNISEKCISELLQPYLDGIVGKLHVLLQNPKQMVQEGALTALASVADSSQD